MSGGGERKRETWNLKQAPDSELSAQSPTWGSNPQTARSCPEPKSDAQLTEPPRRPDSGDFLMRWPRKYCPVSSTVITSFVSIT